MTPQDLIQQYITSGNLLPYHQLKQLNPNQIKSYFRTRLITVEYKPTFQHYEFVLAPIPVRKEILKQTDDDAFVNLMNGRSYTYKTTQMNNIYYPVEPIVDFATMVKLVIECMDDNSVKKIYDPKATITSMVDSEHSQRLYHVKADKEQIYDLLINSPDFGGDKENKSYIKNILATTDTYTFFKTDIGKRKLADYISTKLTTTNTDYDIQNVSKIRQNEILNSLIKTAPNPKELRDLLDQYNQLMTLHLEWISYDDFHEILDSNHPLKIIEIMNPKIVKKYIKHMKTYAETHGGEERYINIFTNRKEVKFIFQNFGN